MTSPNFKPSRRIGILALQGAVQDHIPHLKKPGCEVVQVRNTKDLDGLAGIILPGGESTVMGKFLKEYRMTDLLRRTILDGLPVWGICAGAILLAQEVDGIEGVLGALPIKIRRNAYGRQRESSSADIEVPCFGPGRYTVSFIRAPKIEYCPPECEVLSYHNGDPVFVRHGNIMATTFHPELHESSRFHELFLDAAKGV